MIAKNNDLIKILRQDTVLTFFTTSKDYKLSQQPQGLNQ